jgi:hypothetical protein
MSHGLLIDEPPLQVLPKLAQVIGLNEAIVLQQIHYWQNPRFNKNISNGHHWVYKTYDQWQDEFPFWSIRTIQRIIYNLESLKVIISFTPHAPLDNTKHYAINHEVLHDLMQNKYVSLPSRQVDEDPLVKLTKTPRQVDEDPLVNLTSDYIDTETTTETTTEREENSESVERPISVFSKNASAKKESKKFDKRKKGTALSEDWVLPPEWKAWSVERGMMPTEIDVTEVRFKNYWLSTTKNAIKVDWFRTWQNWCLSECERKGIRFNVKSSPPEEIKTTHGFAVVADIAKKRPSSDPKIQKWDALQTHLSKQVGENEYKSWLSDLELVEINDNAVFKAKSSFVRDYVTQRFIGEICACLGKIDSKLLSREKVKFVVAVNPLRRALVAH